MTKHRKRKPNRLHFVWLFLFLIFSLTVMYFFVSDSMMKFELKRTVKNNPNALVPIFFRNDDVKISVYLDYEYPKYRQISSTKFLLSDRPGGQDFLDFYPTESEFLNKNSDLARNGTEKSGWVGTGWKTSSDKELISGYSFTKRYHYYNVNAAGVKNDLISGNFTKYSTITRTNCVLYLPNLSTSNFPVLYFNADPGEDGANTCSRIKNLKLRFTENNKEIVMSKNAAANVAIRLPSNLIDLPKQYGILVDMDKPDENNVWEMGVYEPEKNKNTTVNRLKIDAKTGKFICAWWEYGRENNACQNGTGK